MNVRLPCGHYGDKDVCDDPACMADVPDVWGLTDAGDAYEDRDGAAHAEAVERQRAYNWHRYLMNRH